MIFLFPRTLSRPNQSTAPVVFSQVGQNLAGVQRLTGCRLERGLPRAVSGPWAWVRRPLPQRNKTEYYVEVLKKTPQVWNLRKEFGFLKTFPKKCSTNKKQLTRLRSLQEVQHLKLFTIILRDTFCFGVNKHVQKTPQWSSVPPTNVIKATCL